MVEQATLNNNCSKNNKKNNNSDFINFFKTKRNYRNLRYLDFSFKTQIFAIFKYNSISSRYFYSRKTLKRLRYLKSLNSKKKPR